MVGEIHTEPKRNELLVESPKMRPIHVVLFNRSFYPDTAATGQILTELCEELVEKYGCRVSVVAGVPLISSAEDFVPPKWWQIFRREEYRGIQILRACGTRFSKDRFAGRVANYLSYFLSACYAGLRLERPDIIIAATDPPIIGLAAIMSSRRYGVPLVMSFRDIFPEVARLLEDFQNDFVEKILQSITSFLARNADLNITLGHTMRAKIIEKKGGAPERTVIIPDWIDCAQVVPGPRQNPFSRANDLDDSFVVMHSGNIGLSQSLETLVETANLLRNFEDLKVVFVGEGAKKAALQARVKELNLENVIFLPYQPKERLTESFGTADVFIISLQQGLAGFIVPSKLYGILAAGRPYVASIEEVSEVALISKKYNCGFVAESGNPRAMADEILRLYNDRGLSRKMGENARRAAMEFDRPVQVRAYYDLIRTLVRNRPARRSYLLKRFFDVLLSGAGLLGSSPLWLMISFWIKMEDGGSVFYSQDRVGMGGRIFRAWKFRSMVPDAEKGLGAVQAQEDDSRVTKVGKILRATAMDELPQLWNIFRGDMGFVGPRAIRPGEKEVHGDGIMVEASDIEGYKERHSVVPGLTGLAQIYGNHDTPRRHKFRYDLLYIKKQRFFLDLKLIVLSFWITLLGKWESRDRKL
jgi:colanic acid biosynthesis glycosyl transferase WcaI